MSIDQFIDRANKNLYSVCIFYNLESYIVLIPN